MVELLIALLAAINVEFSWDAQSDADSYKIGITTTSGSGYTYTSVGAGTAVPGTPPRVSYLWANWDETTKKYFVVKATNDLGDSDPSVEMPLGKPSAPKNPRAVKK